MTMKCLQMIIIIYKHYGLVLRLMKDGTYNKIKDYENVGSSSDNTHGNVHFEKGETKNNNIILSYNR